MTTTPNSEPAANDAMAQIAARMREQMARGEELRGRLTGLTGRAVSEDGLIEVACTADDPAHELRLDPRAMRRPTAELAEVLQELLRSARADLHRQTAEAVREAGDQVGPQSLIGDPAAAQAKLAQLSELVSGPMRESTEMLERLRRQLSL
ncbi:YbaB/EbfC DNA-binding family protein [Micromonospora viridifaciens]|uniref:YbaB/EbfC DNA-binding family protein n=1 Tax=Micromonospora viridifaciens TaxID=1881 RepID=A0A1C4VA36_MICVI|nr:YbaB/EbfC family nucleoid-associated protein [Micromonospora viridifaciens]SCE80837.1 YbaB/EbfC DNA-binding family protein [Micromonospora viridifaciens]